MSLFRSSIYSNDRVKEFFSETEKELKSLGSPRNALTEKEKSHRLRLIVESRIKNRGKIIQGLLPHSHSLMISR